jgi:hypothetical protein
MARITTFPAIDFWASNQLMTQRMAKLTVLSQGTKTNLWPNP